MKRRKNLIAVSALIAMAMSAASCSSKETGNPSPSETQAQTPSATPGTCPPAAAAKVDAARTSLSAYSTLIRNGVFSVAEARRLASDLRRDCSELQTGDQESGTLTECQDIAGTTLAQCRIVMRVADSRLWTFDDRRAED